MDAAVRALRALIADRTGIWVPDSRIGTVESAAAFARSAMRIRDLDELFEELRCDPTASSRAWIAIIGRITVPESYFNRDAAQMSMLNEHILPELIERNRSRRTLRLWSAGCAAGEEVYSLAMSVARLLPDLERWNVLILGTDLNSDYLAAAEAGVYRDWSFRQVPDDQRRHWFAPVERGWKVRPALREMVTFRRGNLVADHWPDPAGPLHDMDLILCRNVFIYFDAAAICDVVGRFAKTLVPGGFLVTGHLEVLGVETESLTQRMLGEALTLQRTDDHFDDRRATDRRAGDRRQGERRQLDRRRREAVRRAAESAGRRTHEQPVKWAVVEKPERSETAAAPGGMEILLAAAMAAADRGALDEAQDRADAANAMDVMAVGPYRTLATIAELRGDAARARTMLSKVFYLDPRDVDACLTLAALEEKGGNSERAHSLRTHARGLMGDEGVPR